MLTQMASAGFRRHGAADFTTKGRVGATLDAPHDYIHIDLVGRISTHHVQDRQTAAGVLIDPFSQVQGKSLVNYDWLALRNLALDFRGGDDSVARHAGCGRSVGAAKALFSGRRQHVIRRRDSDCGPLATWAT